DVVSRPPLRPGASRQLSICRVELPKVEIFAAAERSPIGQECACRALRGFAGGAIRVSRADELDDIRKARIHKGCPKVHACHATRAHESSILMGEANRPAPHGHRDVCSRAVGDTLRYGLESKLLPLRLGKLGTWRHGRPGARAD